MMFRSTLTLFFGLLLTLFSFQVVANNLHPPPPINTKCVGKIAVAAGDIGTTLGLAVVALATAYRPDPQSANVISISTHTAGALTAGSSALLTLTGIILYKRPPGVHYESSPAHPSLHTA